MSKTPKNKNTVISKRKLVSSYDPYVLAVLEEDIIIPVEDEKHVVPVKYEVIGTLPSKERYLEMRNEKFRSTVEDLVSSAMDELQELGQELRDWYENLPEAFQDGEKGSTLDESASMLEEIDSERPEAPVAVAKLEMVFLPTINTTSRSARRDAACAILEAVSDKLAEQEKMPAIEEFTQQIQEAISQAENVEFPGMY